MRVLTPTSNIVALVMPVSIDSASQEIKAFNGKGKHHLQRQTRPPKVTGRISPPIRSSLRVGSHQFISDFDVIAMTFTLSTTRHFASSRQVEPEPRKQFHPL